MAEWVKALAIKYDSLSLVSGTQTEKGEKRFLQVVPLTPHTLGVCAHTHE